MRRFLILATTMLVAVALMPGTALSTAHPGPLVPFTQDELDDNWEGDRRFPTGGVTSVSAFGRSIVAQLSLDSDQAHPTNLFRRTEGIKTIGARNFGDEVQVNLYIDPAWQDNAVRAGLWVSGDNGAGARDPFFGIIEFVNSEPCDPVDCSSHPDQFPDHEGFRIWDSTIGWTDELATPFEYGTWVTLTITLDTVAGQYTYAIDGQQVGTAAGGEHHIREVFLNSYNYGNDNLPTLSSNSYDAHWNVLSNPADKGDCMKGGWQDYDFENQGQCIRFVMTGQDSR